MAGGWESLPQLSLSVDALVDHETAFSLPAGMLNAPLVQPKGHRRSRSDPTDWIHSVRGFADEVQQGSILTNKRAQSRPNGQSPERKRHAPSWLGVEEAPDSPKSKKDVPMWTMQEDLFILDMVEQYGKRWSMIASAMMGRTDNGVRNRYNRMEKAQNLREMRGPRYGYRCRRCGQPKRGHTCTALSTSSDAALGLNANGDTNEAAAEQGPIAQPESPQMVPQMSLPPAAPLAPLPSFMFASTPAVAAAVVQTAPAVVEEPSPEPLPTGNAEPEPEDELAAPRTPPPASMAAAPPQVSPRQSDESIDEQKLDDFLKDLQLSNMGMHPDLFKLGATEDGAAPHPPPFGSPASSLLLVNHALDFLYPSPSATRSPRPLGVC